MERINIYHLILRYSIIKKQLAFLYKEGYDDDIYDLIIDLQTSDEEVNQ